MDRGLAFVLVVIQVACGAPQTDINDKGIMAEIDLGAITTTDQPLNAIPDTNEELYIQQPVTDHTLPLPQALANFAVAAAEAFTSFASLPLNAAKRYLNRVANATDATLIYGEKIIRLPPKVAAHVLNSLLNKTR